MTGRTLLSLVGLVAVSTVSGCVNGVIPGGSTDPTVQAVAAKANSVASSVGGQDGYGGTMMAGYRDHAPDQMGFRNLGDLASSSGTMMMRFHNESEDDCTFEMSYVASHRGIDEQMMDVDVAAGETVTVEIPCAEMVGMGSLEEPGSRACLLSDGEEVDNLMAVPGFLGLDYVCGGTYEHFLMHDVEDLDGDGDTEEHIVMSEAMDIHRMNGGPGRHAHGDGPGMMGRHAGGGGMVNSISAKATEVAGLVGTETGYGGEMMMGYADHMPEQMGFASRSDMAGHGDMMTVSLHNEADQDGTFHLSYFAGHMGFVDQMMDIEVAAGEETMLEIPCSEIVGMGPLHEPGEAGCHLADGQAVDNMMAVPGFLGQDFTCGGTYSCVLTQDVDDLDGDGDTEELVIVSDAMDFHMMNGGPMGHAHGGGLGMMGSHMGM